MVDPSVGFYSKWKLELTFFRHFWVLQGHAQIQGVSLFSWVLHESKVTFLWVILDLHIEGEPTDDVYAVHIHPLVLFQVEKSTTGNAILFSLCGIDEDFSFLVSCCPSCLQPQPEGRLFFENVDNFKGQIRSICVDVHLVAIAISQLTNPLDGKTASVCFGFYLKVLKERMISSTLQFRCSRKNQKHTIFLQQIGCTHTVR